MEKRGQLYEIIIKLTMAIFAIIAAVFVVKNCLSMFPFFKVASDDQALFFEILNKTQIGKVYNDMGIVVEITPQVIFNGFISFISNIEWICIVFLVLFITLLLIRFMFVKWTLVKKYINLSLILILAYLSKYIFAILMLAIFYNGALESIYLSFKVSTILYTLFSLVEIFVLSLWIIKFIFNIIGDLKYLLSD